MLNSLPTKYFDDVYSAHRDPWDFETSEYEQQKYTHTLASLPRDHYKSALEIGCSIGVLTAQLAPRCESLLSIDVSESALAQARARCRHLPHVTFRNNSVPTQFPDGQFMFILLSEVAYYLSRPDLILLADQLAAHQNEGADLLLVHFTPEVAGYPATGDQVHDYFLTRPEWRTLAESRQPRYRLDALRRVSARSTPQSPP